MRLSTFIVTYFRPRTLQIKEKRHNLAQPLSIYLQAEAYASAQAQQAADELGRAQEEIDELERALEIKDHALREEMQHSGRATEKICK